MSMKKKSGWGASARGKKKAATPRTPKPRPEPQSLPGMEDREIAELHRAAMRYAEIRDGRMELLGEEVELKAELLGLMKKHGKETYKYNGVEVNVVHEEETVKVKIKKKEEAEEVEA